MVLPQATAFRILVATRATRNLFQIHGIYPASAYPAASKKLNAIRILAHNSDNHGRLVRALMSDLTAYKLNGMGWQQIDNLECCLHIAPILDAQQHTSHRLIRVRLTSLPSDGMRPPYITRFSGYQLTPENGALLVDAHGEPLSLYGCHYGDIDVACLWL